MNTCVSPELQWPSTAVAFRYLTAEIHVFELHALKIRHKSRYVLVPYGKLNGLCRKYGKLAASNGEAT